MGAVDPEDDDDEDEPPEAPDEEDVPEPEDEEDADGDGDVLPHETRATTRRMLTPRMVPDYCNPPRLPLRGSMRTVRTSILSAFAVAMFFGCVVNNPPPVTPTDVPPVSTDAGMPSTPDATVTPPVGSSSGGSSGSTSGGTSSGGSSGTTTAPPDAGAPTAAGDAGKGCIQRIMCTKDKHFDNVACTCVAGAAAPTGGTLCPQVLQCMAGQHFDAATCNCVK